MKITEKCAQTRAQIGRPFGWLIAALLIASPVAAQPLLAQDEAAVLPRLLSSVSLEIDDSVIGAERAMLMRSAGEDMTADLVILASDPDDRAGQPLLVARNLVYAGSMGGQQPWLEVSERNSLLVRSEQIGIGRSPWEETLTLAWRDGDLLVAGWTQIGWDRLTASSFRCDWNLLTGDWQADETLQNDDGEVLREGSQTGRHAMRIPVTDWIARADALRDICPRLEEP